MMEYCRNFPSALGLDELALAVDSQVVSRYRVGRQACSALPGVPVPGPLLGVGVVVLVLVTSDRPQVAVQMSAGPRLLHPAIHLQRSGGRRQRATLACRSSGRREPEGREDPVTAACAIFGGYRRHPRPPPTSISAR